MRPGTSDWNFTPSVTAAGSPPSTMAGVGLDGQIIAFAGLTVMPRALVTFCEPAVTLTVKLEVPVAVGVPEITPLAGVRVRPAGRVPLATVHGGGRGAAGARGGGRVASS